MRPKRRLRAAAYREAVRTSQRRSVAEVHTGPSSAIYLGFTMRAPLSSSPNHATWFPRCFRFYPLFSTLSVATAEAPAGQDQTMPASIFVKSVAAAALCAAMIVASPAAAQRVIRGYGADEDLQNNARAANGYPQQRASGSYGGGLIEFMLTGGNVGYGASYPQQGGMVRYNDPYRQAYYAPAEPMAGPVQRGINPIYLRHEVAYDGPQRPGTIVIDTPSKFLYLVQPGGRAIRYGIGVGRPGFMWSGVKQVSRKADRKS